MVSGPKRYPNRSLVRTRIRTTYPQSLLQRASHVISFVDLFCSSSEAPGSPTVTVKVEATSITVRWTKPADDGGSPITAYRVLILRGNTKIENRIITDMSVNHQFIGSLSKSTNYTIMVFARNDAFEGKATERKFQTKYEGMKICTKNA